MCNRNRLDIIRIANWLKGNLRRPNKRFDLLPCYSIYYYI